MAPHPLLEVSVVIDTEGDLLSISTPPEEELTTTQGSTDALASLFKEKWSESFYHCHQQSS